MSAVWDGGYGHMVSACPVLFRRVWGDDQDGGEHLSVWVPVDDRHGVGESEGDGRQFRLGSVGEDRSVAG